MPAALTLHEPEGVCGDGHEYGQTAHMSRKVNYINSD